MSRLLALALLALTMTSTQAEVYTWINENGVRVYGDEPPEHAQKATLPKLQSLPDVKPPAEKKPEVSNNTHPDFAGYQQFIVLSPSEDQMINFGEGGNVTVQLQLQPALQIGHKVTLLLNGRPVETAASLQFELDGLARGSYLIQAQIKHQGRLMISTPKRRIHVQRPSILNRPRT